MLVSNPQVSKVNLYLHRGRDAQGKDIWLDPIDLKSEDPAIKAFRDGSVFLSRRGDESLKVPMGTMRGIAYTWRERASQSGLVKFQGASCSLEATSDC